MAFAINIQTSTYFENACRCLEGECKPKYLHHPWGLLPCRLVFPEDLKGEQGCWQRTMFIPSNNYHSYMVPCVPCWAWTWQLILKPWMWQIIQVILQISSDYSGRSGFTHGRLDTPAPGSTRATGFQLDALAGYVTPVQSTQSCLSCPHIIKLNEFVVALVRCLSYL